MFPTGGTIPFQETSTFSVDLVIGQEYALIGSLDVGAHAQAGVNSQDFPTDSAASTAFIDVLNTGHTFLDSTGPFFIVSESGQDYSSVSAPQPPGLEPVPEPASLTLTALGLASLAARRRLK